MGSDRISQPDLRLEALCELADSLVPNLEGNIYDFDGDRVLLELDKSVTDTLEEEQNTISTNVIRRVAEVFSKDYSVWRNCQDYGLFEEAPSKLKGGTIARMRLPASQSQLLWKNSKKRRHNAASNPIIDLT